MRVPLNVLTSSQVKEFHGNTRLTGLTHDKNVSESEMDFNGVVIEIELTPNSEIAKGVVNLNALDEILVGRVGSPSVPSVYAAREITVIKEKTDFNSRRAGDKLCVEGLRPPQPD